MNRFSAAINDFLRPKEPVDAEIIKSVDRHRNPSENSRHSQCNPPPTNPRTRFYSRVNIGGGDIFVPILQERPVPSPRSFYLDFKVAENADGDVLKQFSITPTKSVRDVTSVVSHSNRDAQNIPTKKSPPPRPTGPKASEYEAIHVDTEEIAEVTQELKPPVEVDSSNPHVRPRNSKSTKIMKWSVNNRNRMKGERPKSEIQV